MVSSFIGEKVIVERYWHVVSMSFHKCRADSTNLENYVWMYDHVDESWRARQKSPCNKFFCNTNVLVQNACTKYNVLSVLNLLNMAMFQGYLFAEGTYRAFR